MITVDTSQRLTKVYEDLEQIEADLQEIQDGLVVALREYSATMQQLIKEARE